MKERLEFVCVCYKVIAGYLGDLGYSLWSFLGYCLRIICKVIIRGFGVFREVVVVEVFG